MIVTFAEMGPVDVERPGFGELFLNKRGYDVISVQKRKENWYQDLSIDDLKQAVSERSSVATRPSSPMDRAWADIALYFASAVGGRALSFSPRHHSYYALVGMHAYANQWSNQRTIAGRCRSRPRTPDPGRPSPVHRRTLCPARGRAVLSKSDLNLRYHRSPVHVRSRAWRRSAEVRRGHRGRPVKAAAEQPRKVAAIPAQQRRPASEETHGSSHGPCRHTYRSGRITRIVLPSWRR